MFKNHEITVKFDFMEYESKDVMALIVKLVGESLCFQNLLSYFDAAKGLFLKKNQQRSFISPHENCLDLNLHEP